VLPQKSVIFFLVSILVSACHHSADESEQNSRWKVGGKIHFDEESGNDYMGLKEVSKVTQDALKSVFAVEQVSCESSAKILLKKENGRVHMNHYAEKSRPNIGEELHATLLYTTPRGFCSSETLKQVCDVLFADCNVPPQIDVVSSEYGNIIKPHWRFKVSEVVMTQNGKGTSFIMAKLLFEDRENIYFGQKAISAGLHMALVVCIDHSIFSDPAIVDKLIMRLNERLKGKFIKIASKNGVADLEFGISGQPWRMRAREKVEFKG
jgi:hypothetical protein